MTSRNGGSVLAWQFLHIFAVQWLGTLAQPSRNEVFKSPIGPKHTPLDGPLAVKPHTREYCWCEMNAPMTAPLCWDIGFPETCWDWYWFRLHHSVDRNWWTIWERVNRVGISKMGWCKAKPIQQSTKISKSDSKKDSILQTSINYNKTRNSKPTKSPGNLKKTPDFWFP